MEQGLEVVIAGSLKPSRGRRFNLYFSDTVLHLRVRNISHAPIENICCTGSNSSISDYGRVLQDKGTSKQGLKIDNTALATATHQKLAFTSQYTHKNFYK